MADLCSAVIRWIRTVDHHQTHWIQWWILPAAGFPKAFQKLPAHVQVYNHTQAKLLPEDQWSAVTLIKAFSSERFSGRGRTDQRGLWSGSFRRGEAVCLRRWWTSWWELEWRRRANTSVSDSYWTSGQEETLVNHITRAADLQRCERHAHLLLLNSICTQETWGIPLTSEGLGPTDWWTLHGIVLEIQVITYDEEQ